MRKRIRLEEPKQKQTTFEFKSNVVKDKIGFAMPTYDRIIYLYKALESIKANCKGLNYHIYIVEDCSEKQLAVTLMLDELHRTFGHNRFEFWTNKENLGLGYCWHKAGKKAYLDGCEYIIFCDDDFEIKSKAVIEEMLAVFKADKQKKIGWVAPTGSMLHKFYSEARKHGETHKFVSSCGGGFGMGRAEAMDYINFHDSTCRRAVDVDLCLRMWLSGKSCAVVLHNQVKHITYKDGGLQYPKDRKDPANAAWQKYLVDKFDPILKINKKGHVLFWRAFKNMSPDSLVALRKRVLNKDDMTAAEAEAWLQEVNDIA